MSGATLKRILFVKHTSAQVIYFMRTEASRRERRDVCFIGDSPILGSDAGHHIRMKAKLERTRLLTDMLCHYKRQSKRWLKSQIYSLIVGDIT
jgi:hypothetical protein